MMAPSGSFHEGHCSDTNRADAAGPREHEVKRLQPDSLASTFSLNSQMGMLLTSFHDPRLLAPLHSRNECNLSLSVFFLPSIVTRPL